MAFELPSLPYAYDALEPHYDAETVEIHHSKHHNTYVTKLNAAADTAQVSDKSLEEILTSLDSISEDKRTPVRNHAGGVWNHTFFWHSLSPDGGGDPEGALAAAIEAKWGSVQAFKDAFSDKAANHFGSGWAWLVVNGSGELEITDSHDQVCPLSLGQKPLLTIDVWEHAYYLKYRNVRPDWISAFWQMVSWSEVGRRFEAA
jgi:Fe-Mn family superoxide dismutase|tara:strand:+ start:5788 stop:6393 length:606 start_codon:yes stop_codon:yes gene_type:complete